MLWGGHKPYGCFAEGGVVLASSTGIASSGPASTIVEVVSARYMTFFCEVFTTGVDEIDDLGGVLITLLVSAWDW